MRRERPVRNLAVMLLVTVAVWHASARSEEPAAEGPITPTSLIGGIVQARQSLAPMFVMVMAPNSAEGNRLKGRLNSNASIQKLLRDYVVVEMELGSTLAQDWQKTYKVEGTEPPFIYVVSATVKPISSASGPQSDEALTTMLKSGLVAAAKIHQESGIQGYRKAKSGGAALKNSAPPQEAKAKKVGAAAKDAVADTGDMPSAAADSAEKAIDSGEKAIDQAAEDGSEEGVSAAEETGKADGKDKPRAKPKASTKRITDPLKVAEAHLRTAKVFEKTRPEKAREYAKKAIQAAPASSIAKDARALLGRLK